MRVAYHEGFIASGVSWNEFIHGRMVVDHEGWFS